MYYKKNIIFVLGSYVVRLIVSDIHKIYIEFYSKQGVNNCPCYLMSSANP